MTKGIEDRVLDAIVQNISKDPSVSQAVAMSLARLLRENPTPSADEVLEAVSEAVANAD